VTTLTKKKLLDDLKDKETRDIFVEEHVTAGIPFQLHALREKLGLTQTELARRAGMAQERISKLEDPNYEFIPKINTLLKLASVFDVPLIVRFGSWKELFGWETELSPEKLAPATFEEELPRLENMASGVVSIKVGYVPVQSFRVSRIDAPNIFRIDAPEVSWFDQLGNYQLAAGSLVTGFMQDTPRLLTQLPILDYTTSTPA
jgi:transcriptional regulator with XRE-family HTH domain